MSLVDFAALRAARVAEDPFPHIIVPHFVPSSALRQVIADFPALGKRGSFPVSAVHLGPAARTLTEELESETLRTALANLFNMDLTDSPTMLTLRSWTSERDGRIHCDSAAKRMTALLYLNPAGDSWQEHQGCLRLLRGPGNLDDYVTEIPPVDGTLLVFRNGPHAWHGHKIFTGQRFSIQLNYMTTDAKARSELRRHRISAFLKRCASPGIKATRRAERS